MGIFSDIKIIDGEEGYFIKYLNRSSDWPNYISYPNPFDKDGNIRFETEEYILKCFKEWILENNTKTFLILSSDKQYLGKEDGSVLSISDLSLDVNV